MPREHYSKAHPSIQQQIRGQLAAAADNIMSPLSAVNFCFVRGFDLTIEDLPLTLSRRVDAAKTDAERNRIMQSDPTRYANEQAALNAWQAHRGAWSEGSKVDDESKASQQREAADAERARITQTRFVDGLVVAVQSFLASEWHRANAKWKQEHEHRVDVTDEPTQPSFNDTVDAVLTRLGYVRVTEQATRTRKAS